MNRNAFLLRIPEKLQKALKHKAFERGESINQLCTEVLENSFHPQAVIEPLIDRIQKTFSNQVAAVALFGSTARGENTKESDTDLLIVLNPNAELNRELYHRWDQEFSNRSERNLSPHFVLLHKNASEIGSIWYEVALEGKILWDPSGELEKSLRLIRTEMAENRIQRKWSHGHPYWVNVE